jgi:hypothetical protein
MVNVLASSVVNNGFGSWSGQTGDYKIGICAPLRRMSKEWYVRNHDNVSKWRTCLYADCCFDELAL